MDVIWQWLGRDWAQIGGWTLFLGLCILVVSLMLRDKLVSGRRLEKLEARHEATVDRIRQEHATAILAEQGRTERALTAAETNASSLSKAMDQIETLTQSQSLFDYVLRELMPASPKRGASGITVSGRAEPERTGP